MSSPYTIERDNRDPSSPALFARFWAGDFVMRRSYTPQGKEPIVSYAWTCDNQIGSGFADVLRKRSIQKPFTHSKIVFIDRDEGLLEGNFNAEVGLAAMRTSEMRQAVARITLWGNPSVIWVGRDVLDRQEPPAEPNPPYSYLEVTAWQSQEQEAVHLARSMIARVGTFAIMRHGQQALQDLTERFQS